MLRKIFARARQNVNIEYCAFSRREVSFYFW